MYALQFPHVIPETIVSADKQVIRQFMESIGAAILKPLGNKAGEGILYLEPGDRNFNSIVELSTLREGCQSWFRPTYQRQRRRQELSC